VPLFNEECQAASASRPKITRAAKAEAFMDVVRRLARWRVPLGYVLGVIAFWFTDPTAASLSVGAAVGALGEALRIWAAGHLEKGREVTTTGPYAFTRHPLYLGSSIMGVGFAIAAHSIVVAVVVFIYLGVTIAAAIRSEEAHLTEKFGGSYPAYREGTSAPAAREFSFERAARNREYRALAGLIAVWALLTAKFLFPRL
jgi:protein-S-isoprenylcysteine O-methyltransferase Ste14